MEGIAFQLYGTLILTVVGFVLPIIAIAMLAFPEGVKALRKNYENEQKQAEENLEDELKKRKSGNMVDYGVLSENIAILKSTQKKAKKRLFYLNPRYILSKSAITVGASFVSFLAGLYFYTQTLYVPLTLFIISIGLLSWAMVIFYNAIGIIIEASTAVQLIRRASEEKILELLTGVADNSKQEGTSLFIDQKDVKIFFNNEEISEEKKYTFSVNNKHGIAVMLKNLSRFMWKTAELGFTFPADFLIEGSTNFSIYTGDKEKIIRYKHDHLQSGVNQLEGNVNLTFLKTGTFNVSTFIKGENLIWKTIKFKIKVVN